MPVPLTTSQWLLLIIKGMTISMWHLDTSVSTSATSTSGPAHSVLGASLRLVPRPQTFDPVESYVHFLAGGQAHGELI